MRAWWLVVGSGDCPIRSMSVNGGVMYSKRSNEPDSTRSRHSSVGMATARWVAIAQSFAVNHSEGTALSAKGQSPLPAVLPRFWVLSSLKHTFQA